MLLKTRTFVLFILVIILSFSSQILTRIFIELPEYKKLENINDKKDVDSFYASFKSLFFQIEVFSTDYSNWDDTVDFIQSRDMSYIESNFPEKQLISSGLNGALYLDNLKNIIFSRAEESRTGKLINDPFIKEENRILLDKVFITDEQVNAEGSSLSNTGLLIVDDKPLIFSITSITNSEAEPPSYGNLLVWKYLDKDISDYLKDTTQLDFKCRNLTEEEINNIEDLRKNDYKRDKNNKISLIINDFFNNPVLQLEIQQKGHNFDNSVFSKNLIVGIITSLLAILYVFYFINSNFLKTTKIFLRHFKKVEETSDYSLKLELERNDELSVLADSINMLMQKTNQRKQLLINTNRELEFLSNTDGLTQIPNRRHLDLYLREKWEEALKEGFPVSLFICDVDFFKLFNDNYGHSSGDIVLKEVALSLKNNLHSSTDYVARYGGEEFAVILFNTDAENSCHVAENLINSIENLKIPHSLSKCSSYVTISIGIATIIPGSTDTINSFIESADKSLYKAKSSGRNRYMHSNEDFINNDNKQT